MFEILNIPTVGISANSKVKQFRKSISTYSSNIYRLPKFAVLGPEYIRPAGRAAPSKTEDRSDFSDC